MRTEDSNRTHIPDDKGIIKQVMDILQHLKAEGVRKVIESSASNGRSGRFCIDIDWCYLAQDMEWKWALMIMILN